jgi:hypothetical protein
VTKRGGYGKYWSEHFKEYGQQPELQCECRHPGVYATPTTVRREASKGVDEPFIQSVLPSVL